MNDYIATLAIGAICGVVTGILIQFVPGRIPRSQVRINKAVQDHLASLGKRLDLAQERITLLRQHVHLAGTVIGFDPDRPPMGGSTLMREAQDEWDQVDDALARFRAEVERLGDHGRKEVVDDVAHEPGS